MTSTPLVRHDLAVPKVAFVTGATGFVGLNLVEELARQGWRVIALHRAGSDLKYLRRMPAQRVVGDVTDPASLLRALPETVDAVFHVAGDTGLWSGHNAQQDRVNIEGTRNMVAAALERRARRFVHTSSISAYGMQGGRLEPPRRGCCAPSPRSVRWPARSAGASPA